MVRILQVIGAMNRGGVETWLMHVLNHIDRNKYQMDFLLHTDEPYAYSDEIRALGAGLVVCPQPNQPLVYGRHLKEVLRKHGPYHAVHSHLEHYSGYILKVAAKVNVPVRIAHTHTNNLLHNADPGLKRRLYLALMKRWINRHATVGLALSRKAAPGLFGPAWEEDPRWQIHYYGIDLNPFGQPVNPSLVRKELGIPKNAAVIGHVGRFHSVKNHTFLLDIAAEVFKREPEARLLLVGDGQLRHQIEQKALKLGISDKVVLTGSRPDVPRLVLGAMDIFLLPSLYEGFGMVLLEAQAAGLPCIFSDVVPEEVDVIRPLVRRLSLTQSPAAWADAVRSFMKNRPSIPHSEALKLMEKSAFNIKCNVRKLEQIYSG
jgi:glycosyltransferase involved in cell wall biosynthesis